MQARARLKFLMMSPRKVRQVADLVKDKSVEDAVTILKFTNKAAAEPLRKTIESATANALSFEGTSKLKAEDLEIRQIIVDGGPVAKRIQFRAMGRAFRIRKRFSHLTVVVEGEPQEREEKKKKTRKAKAVNDEPAEEKKTTRRGRKKTKAAEVAPAPEVKEEVADVATDDSPVEEIAEDKTSEIKNEETVERSGDKAADKDSKKV